MNEQDGTLSFATAIDTSGYDAGMRHIEERTNEATASVEQESARMGAALVDIPKVNIDFITNASQSLETIDAAFAQIDSVVETNRAEVKKLEDEYAKLSKAHGDAFMKGDDDSARSIATEMEAVKKLTQARKAAIKEAEVTADELVQVEKRIKEEASATTQAETSHVSLKTRIRELTLQLAEMEMQGLRNTDEFRQLSAEAGMLQDQMADTRTQVSVLADDQAGFKGMLSVISGVSGGFTALTGAMSLFGSENEDLQKVMTKLQGVMALTMGLQQVSEMVNKDSAASIVVLNGLKEWWNKLVAIGTGAEVAETSAKTANTAATTASTVAHTAEAAAKKAVATSSGEAAAATTAQSLTNTVETATAETATVANITLAGAFKMVGAAIKSIPVFGWVIAGISALIAVISAFVSKSHEADEELKKQQELVKDSREAYAKASVEIENYQNKITSFNGTQAEEKKLIEELNQKYGTAMGYHKTLAEWKDILKSKGSAYCEIIMLEAQAQAILNKYTESYINLLETKEKAGNGEFDSFWRTGKGNQNARQKAIKEAEDEMNSWKSQYDLIQQQIQKTKDSNGLNTHVDTTTSSTSRSSSVSSFDAEKASANAKKAIDEWKDTVKKYLSNANDEITKYSIDKMADGQAKEITQIEVNTAKQKKEWENKLTELAEARKDALKEVYMTKNGATEAGWDKTAGGQKSVEEYKRELLQNEEIAKQFNSVMADIVEDGERKKQAVRQKYTDALIDSYGTTEQKEEKLQLEWMKKLAFIPSEYLPQAIEQMEKEFSSLSTENFKKGMNWDSVFGDLSKQSTDSIEFALERVSEYFSKTKDSMSTEDIKNFSEAIKNMENEITSRNPLSAFLKSIKDITTSKTELVSALKEMETSQEELSNAQNEYNEAKKVFNELEQAVSVGDLAEDSEEYANAEERLKTAKTGLQKATDKNNKAEQNAVTARNNLTSAYKNFATQLSAVNGLIQGLGTNAKNLASVFSTTVANGIGKALDTLDEVMGASTSVINALSDTSKSVVTTITKTVDATGKAIETTSQTAATSISTMEKASVILTIISAALQVATAIANMFNEDDKKQENIDKLQDKIDELQWQLDNINAIKLEETLGKSFEKVTSIVEESRKEILGLTSDTSANGDKMLEWLNLFINKSSIYENAVTKIADAYASAAYSADKFLGQSKWDSAREQLENYATQMTLVQQQIDEEESKKKSDSSTITKYKEQLTELTEEMSSLVNDMVEDIIGGSATDIATQLGDAFIEACQNGEDAMQAWADTANDIIRSVIKQMLVSKFLEEPLGQIFDKYKSKWFGDDGTFAGIDAVIDSMTGFSNDLNAVGESFSQIWSNLPSSVTDMFSSSERSGTSSGIATASQESVDENNARLTTIQAHTFTLVEGVQELNSTGSLMLARLTGIEENTSVSAQRLAGVENQVKSVKSTLDDIQLKGLKIWN